MLVFFWNTGLYTKQLFFLTRRQDPSMMQSDFFRDKVRGRAYELVDWILDSGDGHRLGLTREHVQTSLSSRTTGKLYLQCVSKC